MSIPFTIDQFLDVFARYNDAIWPIQILLNVMALAAVVLTFRGGQYAGKLISFILAFFWLWMGIVYHLMFFTSINPAAFIFGIVFIIQGILFLWLGGIRNLLVYKGQVGLKGSAGIALIAYGLLIYPLLGYWLGHSFPRAPTFGAPCPTTIFTLGILAWAGSGIPRYLFVIPILWSVFAFTAVLNMGMGEDFGLLVAGLVALTLLLIRKDEGVPVTPVSPRQ